MTAPSVRSSATASAAGSLSLTVSRPSGAAAGDVLLMLLMTRNITSSTLPSGFSAIATTTGFGDTYAVLAKKLATGSEPASYGPTLTDSFAAATSAAVILHAISGADYDNIVSLGTGANTASVPSTNPVASAENLVLSMACAAGDPSSNATQPSTWSLVTSVASSVPFDEMDCRVQSATKEFNAGSIGAHAWSASRNVMLACAIPPAAVASDAGNAFLMVL